MLEGTLHAFESFINVGAIYARCTRVPTLIIQTYDFHVYTPDLQRFQYERER